MRSYIHGYLFLFFILSPFMADAQILNRVRRAAEQGVSRAVEKRVEKEVENVAQRQLEKAFRNIYGDDADNTDAPFDVSKIMKGININVPTEDVYNFTGVAEMEMTGTDEKGKAIDPILMTSFITENSDFSAMEFSSNEKKKKEGLEKTIMIFDMKNNASIILMENEGEKTRMALGLNYDLHESIIENDTLSFEDVQFEKTGRTKTIAGYPCDEYKAENEEYVAFYWATQDAIGGIGTFWGKNSSFLSKKMKTANKEYFERLPDGDILEITSQNKEDKTTWNMTMTSVDTSKATNFVMADYSNMMDGQAAKN